MGQRIASAAQEVLADAGIEALGTIGGDEAHGTLTLSDPRQARTASRVLRQSGMSARKVGSLTMEVMAMGEEDDEEDDLSRLVAGWQKFQSHSQDGGYRKACRGIKARAKQGLSGDEILAAHQIADKTAELAESSGSSALARLSAALKHAALSKDTKKIGVLLGTLSASDRSPRPVVLSPNQMEEAYSDDNENFSGYQEQAGQQVQTQEMEPQSLQELQGQDQTQESMTTTTELEETQETKKRMSKRQRMLQAFSQSLFDDAFSTLVRVAGESNLTPQDIRRLGTVLDAEFNNWRTSIDASDRDATDAWKQASQAVSLNLEEDGRRAVGASRDDDGLTYIFGGQADSFNQGFDTSSVMNMPRTAGQMTELVEELIEHYAADIHPTDLDEEDVQDYLDEHAPEVCPKKTMKKLKKILKKGLPNRDEDRTNAVD